MRYVYLIRNLTNSMVYVGQTKNLSWRKGSHLYAARKGIDRPLYRAMREHGVQNFAFELLEECEDDRVSEREKHWVAHFDAFNPAKGYNLTRGGARNTDASAETCQKLRAALAGKPKTVEHCENISVSRRGWEGLRGDKNPNRKRVIEGRSVAESTSQLLSEHAARRTGEKNPNAKLTDDMVHALKQRLSEGASISSTAREFGIGRTQVYRIRDGQHRKDVKVT